MTNENKVVEEVVEVVENESEVVVDEKSGIGSRIKSTLHAVPEALKKPKTWVIGGVTTVAGIASLVAWGVSRRREEAKIEAELAERGLTIEDVPELQAEIEAEYGVVS